MKLVEFKTKKESIYINPESIAYVQPKNSKNEATNIGFISGNSMYVNFVEVAEPIESVLKKLEFYR